MDGMFWADVDRSSGADGCWVWRRGKTPRGYGKVWRNGRHVYVHRLAYETFVGPIPEGLGVLHRCDNPPCCNPAHLFIGTDADNAADRVAKGRHPHKVTAALVAVIQQARADGVPNKAVAARLGVHSSVVSRVGRGIRIPRSARYGAAA